MADTEVSDLAAVTDVLDTDEFYVARAGVSKKIDGIDLSIGLAVPYILLRDEKAQNTSGGTFTSGAWQTRTLNTEVTDTDSLCSLASNQITLAAGSYRCMISCPAWKVGRHQARLQNVTDATTILVGTSEWSENAAGNSPSPTRSLLIGLFTIAASKAIEVQHRCAATLATQGFGVEANHATEVYTVAEFWRVG